MRFVHRDATSTGIPAIMVRVARAACPDDLHQHSSDTFLARPLMPLIVGIPKEIYPEERRVAATPATIERFRKLGLEVQVQSGAGDAARLPTPITRRAAPPSSATPPRCGARRT